MKAITLLNTVKQDIKDFNNNKNNFNGDFLTLEKDKDNITTWYALYCNSYLIHYGPLEEINIAIKSLLKYKESL